MADLMNPYANPYLPSFVNQRPRLNDVKPIVQGTPNFTQIRSVNGYDGARSYAANQLAAGSSDIIAESDPNTARVYIVAKDSTGQVIVEGYRLIHEEEPKPITMEDLNAKMSEILTRMNKLEGERENAKPDNESSWKNNASGQTVARAQPNSKFQQSTSSGTANDAK